MSAFIHRYLKRQEQLKKDTEVAERFGLLHNQLIILRALGDGGNHDYREIVQATGIYSNLVVELRRRHGGDSLAAKGLVAETTYTSETGRTVFLFHLTRRGMDLLERTTWKDQPSPTSFIQRYTQRKEKEQAEKEALRGTNFKHGYYLLLKALEDGDQHDFSEIARSSGIPSNLTKQLREHHQGSLSDLGLVREEEVWADKNGDLRLVVFRIMPRGRKLLESTQKRLAAIHLPSSKSNTQQP